MITNDTIRDKLLALYGLECEKYIDRAIIVAQEKGLDVERFAHFLFRKCFDFEAHEMKKCSECESRFTCWTE